VTPLRALRALLAVVAAWRVRRAKQRADRLAAWRQARRAASSCRNVEEDGE
jgi:hypothetical protein